MATISLLLAAMAATPALAETVHGVLVFTRHGDRTAKYYSGYQMTNLGVTQVYESGPRSSNMTNRAGPSSPLPNSRELSARLYPPLDDLDQQLAIEALVNGTSTTDPLNGYQFILIHGEAESDPDTIWIKGDDACPAYSHATKSYSASPDYKSKFNETQDFYSQLIGTLGPIMGVENVTYKNAYDVFDLLNVASIHNESVASEINADDLDQLRYLANRWDWNSNFTASQPDRSIGGMALAGGILQRLQVTTDTRAASNKFQLVAGSYDTFLAFFGLTNLTAVRGNFYGLPNYAASMAFELFTTEGSGKSPASFPSTDAIGDALQVRFLFRNGSDASDELNAYSLFGRSELAMPYGQFVGKLEGRAINSLGQWCATCGSTEDFCLAANATSSDEANSSSAASTSSGSSLSNAAAGGIGAGVTLAVMAIFGLALWLILRKRKQALVSKSAGVHEKGATESASESA